MSDREALLRAVVENPNDDLPRLCFADWLEENGEAARAEFVRVQCELAGQNPPITNMRVISGLRRRERELWNDSRLNGAPHPWFGQMGFRHTANWLTTHDKPEMTIPIGRNRERRVVFAIARGFVNSLEIDWPDFLRVHRSLIWPPGMTDECPKCKGTGWRAKDDKHKSRDCQQCKNGRIPRPFPPTAQPIREVRLKTWPGNPINGPPTFELLLQFNYGGGLFKREKCPTCEGGGAVDSGGWTPWGELVEVACPDCQNGPPNRWRCETWPQCVFVMPS